MDLTQLANSLPYMILIVWSLFWKGWALWMASRNEQKKWFVLILVLNSIGIVEILYLLFFQKKNRYWELITKKLLPRNKRPA